MTFDSDMLSFTDFKPYKIPIDFGNLRSTKDYTSIEKIQDSQSSSVHKSRDNISGEIVAIKGLEPIFPDSLIQIDQIRLREISIMKHVNHDNVIKLIEVVMGQEGDRHYPCLVMEYCPTDIYKLIKAYAKAERDISQPQVKSIIKQMFLGLNYLHKNFIIHRDLKPENLLVNKDGKLKISDFGLSRTFHKGCGKLTGDLQTIWYRAPELLFEAPYGPEIDLWSAGCIMAELFERKPLFPGSGQIAQINLIIGLIGSPKVAEWPGFRGSNFYKTKNPRNQPQNHLDDRLWMIHGSPALKMVHGLLTYNPRQRLTAQNCIEQDWFDMAPFSASKIDIRDVLLSSKSQSITQS